LLLAGSTADGLFPQLCPNTTPHIIQHRPSSYDLTMLSRSILLRKTAALASSRARTSLIRAPLIQARCGLRLASTVVKVPEMAESISEGTLKQFSKKVGDYVERDEEIATIETDKVASATPPSLLRL
jgi:hypothetical protein